MNAVPKGKSTALALLRSKDIHNYYSARQAEAVTGTSKVFRTLWESSKAVSELNSLTIVHRGTYKESGGINTYDTVDTEIRLFPQRSECWYLLDILETVDSKTVTSRHAEAWSDGARYAIWSENKWDTGRLAPKNAGQYVGIYDRLFGPDFLYCENFDYAEENGEIVLTGFSTRFELLGDPTSDSDTNYYFDVVARFDAGTRLLRSVTCTYRDTWQESEGLSDVVYISEYTIKDINGTVMPTDTHGLDKALEQ